ncbi:MAG: amino acid ABC transporter ATP-binding protein [Tenericutes bacterium]|nr:amino acid ABC transporter ATP-binding protein [Mycoplasmatota bacterium]
MISVNKISKKYGKRYVFKNISFDIKDREKLLIIGPSGCGKTTLIRCLNGLNKVNSGNIFLNGVKINQIDDVTLKSKVGMVFQNYNLFPHLTVRENVALAPKLLKMGSDEEIDDLVKKLLSKVNIINKIDSYPSKLSGGEKQRVAIARTLATKPEVILFDEPTSALDPATISDFILLLKELSRTTTIVVVSHEMDLIKSFADKVLFLKNGSILEYGTADEILNSKNEEVRNFLGK